MHCTRALRKHVFPSLNIPTGIVEIRGCECVSSGTHWQQESLAAQNMVIIKSYIHVAILTCEPRFCDFIQHNVIYTDVTMKSQVHCLYFLDFARLPTCHNVSRPEMRVLERRTRYCCSWRWHSRTYADRDSSRNAYLSRNVHSIQLERSSELHRV